MSVETVLAKIVGHNEDVLGCIATHADQIYSNLPDGYSIVDCSEVTEYVQNMFALGDELDGANEKFDQIFIEYNEHSFYVRLLEDGVLLLLIAPIQRTIFKKVQVGVNLFIKPLGKALSEAAVELAKAVEEPAPDAPPAKRPKRIYRGVEY